MVDAFLAHDSAFSQAKSNRGDFTCNTTPDRLLFTRMAKKEQYTLVLPYHGAISGTVYRGAQRPKNQIGSGYLSVSGSVHFFEDGDIVKLFSGEFKVEEPE